MSVLIRRYPTNKWQKLGTFHARDERTVQSFPLDEHLYAKYVKVSTVDHYLVPLPVILSLFSAKAMQTARCSHSAQCVLSFNVSLNGRFVFFLLCWTVTISRVSSRLYYKRAGHSWTGYYSNSWRKVWLSSEDLAPEPQRCWRHTLFLPEVTKMSSDVKSLVLFWMHVYIPVIFFSLFFLSVSLASDVHQVHKG